MFARSRASRWLLVWVVAALSGVSALQASPLGEFRLQRSNDPDALGGVFSDGAIFYGSFTLDTSLPLLQGTPVSLSSWEIWTTAGPGGPGQLYSSGRANASAWLNVLIPLTVQLDFDEIAFHQDASTLFLQFVQPAGRFAGGLVLGAMEVTEQPASPWSSGYREDFTGSALAVDPVVDSTQDTPELATSLAVGTGILVLAARLRRA